MSQGRVVSVLPRERDEVADLERVGESTRVGASSPWFRNTPESRRQDETMFACEQRQVRSRKLMGGGRLEAAGPDLECEEP